MTKPKKEVFRTGYEDIHKAAEMYEIIVDVVQQMNSFWRSYPEMLQDWLPR